MSLKSFACNCAVTMRCYYSLSDNMRKNPIALLALVALSFAAPSLHAQCVSLTAAGSQYTQDFNSLALTGTSSTLPSGWFLSESGANANTTYTAGTGSANSGDTYSFGPAGSNDRAFGTLQSGSLVPTIGACFTNNTGVTVTSLNISYTGEQWRLGTSPRAEADRLDFQYSLSATSLTSGTYTPVPSLSFSAPNLSGTVGALNGNLAANRSAISGTISGVTIPNGTTIWVRWSDFNVSGADDGLAVDDFSFTPVASSTPILSINDVTIQEGNGGATNFTFTVSLSTPAAAPVTFDIATADNSALAPTDYTARTLTSQSIPAGLNSYTFTVSVNGDLTPEPDETFFVNVTNVSNNANTSKTQGIGTILNDDIVPISQIQGTGNRSPYEGSTVLTRGIVTAHIRDGFFLQSTAADVDGDPLTSEGVFVFSTQRPAKGSLVSVSGKVTEYSDDNVTIPITEISNNPVINVISSGNALPTPITLTAADLDPNQPCNGGTRVDRLERYESMRVTVPSLRSISGTELSLSDADQNGMFYAVLSSYTQRPLREAGIECNALPNVTLPANVSFFDSNPEVFGVDTDRQTGIAIANIASGATFTDVTGVLDYRERTYTIAPDVALVAPPIPPSTPVRAPRAAEFTVASMNVERLSNIDADLQKVADVIKTKLLNPDVIAFQELADLARLQTVANKLNAQVSPNPMYQAILIPSANDSINSGLLVKTYSARGSLKRVDVQGTPQLLGESQRDAVCNNNDVNDRPPLLTRVIVNGPVDSLPLTILAVHQKSLIATDDPAAGNCNRRKRQLQSDFLAQQIQLLNAENLVVLGDFNAFTPNDGLVDVIGDVLGSPAPADQVIAPVPDYINPNLIELSEQLLPAQERWSYLFHGDAQVLDHILVSSRLLPFVSGFDFLHNNAQYPGALKSDYSRPERISDHDNPIAYFVFGAVDNTAGIRVVSSGMVLNRATGVYSGTLTLINTTGSAINGPLQTVLTQVPAGVTVENRNGDYQNNPYLTYNGGLAAGQSVTIPITLRNPTGIRLNWLPKVYTGSF